MIYLLIADAYGEDGCDYGVMLLEGTYEECQKEQDRITGHCGMEYWNFEIVSKEKINGIR